jgi:hypothetical protein
MEAGVERRGQLLVGGRAGQDYLPGDPALQCACQLGNDPVMATGSSRMHRNATVMLNKQPPQAQRPIGPSASPIEPRRGNSWSASRAPGRQVLLRIRRDLRTVQRWDQAAGEPWRICWKQ